MDEKYVKVDDIVEYCNTYSVYLQGKGQGVAQCALRYVKEFAKENATDVQPVKHGKWNGYTCSECNVCADYFVSGDFYFDEKPNFCPNLCLWYYTFWRMSCYVRY